MFSGLKNETRLMGLLVGVRRGPVPGVSADESVGLLAEEEDVDLVPDFARETEEQGVVGVIQETNSMAPWCLVVRTVLGFTSVTNTGILTPFYRVACCAGYLGT
jgi:hypothetical protein